MDVELGPAITIEDEMRQSYMDYAMSVIVGRALPDVRDGLKPVQRRVLYAMLGEGLLSNRKTSKCAGVVGEVLKRLHPHGDIPVYDALARLAQPWNLRYPLIYGQGNFGSIDGDPPAAYRYTECRMSVLAERLLDDIEQNTVDFIPNFDDSNEEPICLPASWPNLLVNGADGIAVGMATHIPPHNLGEVVDGTVALIKNPNLDSLALMEYIPGPDFPTGGIIQGTGPVKSAYKKGRGIVKISGKTTYETVKRKSREVEAIIIHEIPYQVNKARLIEKTAALVNEKTIEGISQIRDESDRDGMRVVIELKRDATKEVVLNQLLKLTPLRTSFGVINLAIVEGRPAVCSLKDLITHFINHRRDVITRRTQFQLNKAQARMHILEGFRIALLNLDDVIQLIKSSDTPKTAKTGLMKKYDLSDIQAQAILDLRLQKLTGMERQAIEQEYEELGKEIERLMGILKEAIKVDEIIISELEAIKEKYADARRTLIEEAEQEDFNAADLIEDEDMVVTVSHRGYVKRTSTASYRAQKRGGKGVAGASSKDDDFVEHLFVASTHSNLLVFTSLGRLYWLKVYEIPEAGRTARGRALVNLLNLKEDENITSILPVREFRDDQYVLMCSEQGYIKKTGLKEFSRPRKGGIVACSLAEQDSLIAIAITSGEDDILLSTSAGLAIRFSEADVRPMGRTARGVRGVKLGPDDRVVGAAIVSKVIDQVEASDIKVSEDATLLTVCENGYGKRTKLSEYRAQSRGGKGVIDIQVDGRNGPVVGVAAVNEDSGLMIITSSGKIIRFNAADISVIGRNTKGVRLINLEEAETVVAVAKIQESDNGQ